MYLNNVLITVITGVQMSEAQKKTKLGTSNVQKDKKPTQVLLKSGGTPLHLGEMQI